MTEMNSENNKPLVSVVVPTYNRAAVISATVESVLSQTYPNWELIIVDDCSKDVDQLEKYVADLAHPAVRLLKHSENRHGSAARNTGIKDAKGEFIALLDSDDVWTPDHLMCTVPLVQGEKTVIYTQVDTALGVLPQRPLAENELVCDYLLSRKGLMQTSSLVLSSRFAREVLFNETLTRFQDLDFAIRLQVAGGQFVLSNSCTVLMTDADAGARISNQVNVKPALYWLDRIDPHLSDEAAVAFYVKRVARLHVISLHQHLIFKDMPRRVREALNSGLKARLFAYSITPGWVINLARKLVKLKKKIKG